MRVIAGNCILESFDISEKTADFLMEMQRLYGFDLIYKSSWLKDNRSDPSYHTGLDYNESITIFRYLKIKHGFSILTDFTYPEDLDGEIINYIDIIQIPAYLCMQTHLVQQAAAIGQTINIKKGQFLHPADVNCIIRKIKAVNKKTPIWITERGTCFGYRDLVVDPRSLYTLRQTGYPVFVDIGHAVRKYGIPSSDTRHGGNKQFINTLAKMAVALGCHIFVEVHPNPEKALCDAATQLNFEEFQQLMEELIPFRKLAGEIYAPY